MAGNTENQLLRDPAVQPTDEVIAEGLGSAYDTFVAFVEGLKEYGITLMDWRYYNDGKSWLSKGEYKWTTARGTNKVKPIFWLSIWDGFFKTSFFLGYDALEELLSLPVSQQAREIIKNATPMGKTNRFLPVVLSIDNETQLNDVYVLAQYKKAI